jgi:hypothetical protein
MGVILMVKRAFISHLKREVTRLYSLLIEGGENSPFLFSTLKSIE